MHWHARLGDKDGNSYQVVFHLPIPAVNNRVGTSYQVALVNSGLGGKTVMPDGDGTGGTISATEKAAIQAGSIYEHSIQFPTNPGQTLTQLGALLDALYTQYSNTANMPISGLAHQLDYYGGQSSS